MSDRDSATPPDGGFREAMASFPSGVTIVTTTDETGRWWGFTATSFCSVSADPPLVLVCLAETAECRPIFGRVQHWNVHIINSDHAELALRFATHGTDKFAGAEFVADERGLPRLPRACVIFHCATHVLYPGGDHTILLGRVEYTHLDKTPPALYFQRAFHPLNSATA